MTGFLNQDEIDDLLGVDNSSESSASKSNFSFGDQPKIIRGKIPALDIVNDRFARSYQRVLGRYIGASVNISPNDVKSMKMADFLKHLLQPTSLNICKLKPFEGGSIIVVVEAKLIYSLLNFYLGGQSDRHYKIEGKDFHPFEKEYIKQLLVGIFNEYAAAWEPIQKVEIEQIYSDTNPSFESSTNPNEAVYVSKVSISFEGGIGSVFFCIPLAILRPHLDKLEEKVKSYQGGAGNNWKPFIANESLGYRLTVDCIVAQTTMRLGDVGKLTKGDIVPISMLSESVVTAEGQPIFVGKQGVSVHGFKAVKVSRVISHPVRGDKV